MENQENHRNRHKKYKQKDFYKKIDIISEYKKAEKAGVPLKKFVDSIKDDCDTMTLLGYFEETGQEEKAMSMISIPQIEDKLTKKQREARKLHAIKNNLYYHD